MEPSDGPESLSSLPGLEEWCRDEGFVVEDTDQHEAVTINDRERGSIWWLFRVGLWLQIKGLIFEDVRATDALCLSIARLHARLLGCRYGVDGSDLWLYADFLPDDQSGNAVGAAIIQMQAIVDSTYDLLLRVQESGIAADEAAIDDAFQLTDPGFLH